MKIETELEFSVEKCRQNTNKLYVFGDNRVKKGKGGQAIIRDEINTFGIATKYNCYSSYHDNNLVINKQYIDEDINALLIIAETYDAIVFPAYGLGTGLALLQSISPHTFLYLSQQLLEKFNFNNLKYLRTK